MLAHFLDIYWVSLLIVAIASFFASPYNQHPVLTVLHQLTDPICAPARKLIPPIAGLDVSFLFVFMAISVVDMTLIQTLKEALEYSPNYRGLILGL